MIYNPGSIGTAVDVATAILSEAKIENSRREAHLLLQYVTDTSVAQLRGFPDYTLSNPAWRKFWALTKRRAQQEPFAYLVRMKEFWSLPFHVTRNTLIPRPESETVIETILDYIPNKNGHMRLLDLGTGCGCLLGALLKEYRFSVGLGIDINNTVTDIARRNMKLLGFQGRSEIRNGNWGTTLNESFDIIVCNPPYIRSQEINILDIGVRQFEPHIALDGGKDGLKAYRILAEQFLKLLTHSGLAVIEFGYGQAYAVANIFQNRGLKIKLFGHDLASHKRCLLATL